MRLITAILLLATIPASSPQAENLGRLFFTPKQRAQIVYDHAHKGTPNSETTSVLMVNGIVQQHGGARTVWINGTAQNSGTQGEPATETIAVPGKAKNIKIKVGQKLLLDTPAPQNSPVTAE